MEASNEFSKIDVDSIRSSFLIRHTCQTRVRYMQ
jgi:hypothetical protein